MDIPYTVETRPDTGLYNAKVGLWLFLASEVMLFGALFSSYILLRVGAPEGFWPTGWLNVPLGTVNTLVLISSSITTVMAWAACKMNRFDRFKFFHACTLLCALVFVGIKSFEYRDKFLHYEITLKDGRFADGHMIENKLQREGNTYSGYAVLSGHVVDDRRELYNLHAHKPASHERLRVEGADVVKSDNYGPWHNTFTAIYFTLTGLHALHVIGGALVIGYFWGPGSRMWKTDPERFTNRIEISGLFWHFVDLVWIFLFPVLYLL